MNENQRTRIQELFIKAAREFKLSNVVLCVPTDLGRESKTQFLGTTQVAYHELVRQLLETEAWREKYSETFLAENISEGIVNIRRANFDRQTANEFLDRLISSYESYRTEQTVILPLSGITLARSVSELRLGRVTLFTLSATERDAFRERIRAQLLNELHDNEAGHPNALFGMIDRHLIKLNNCVCSRLHIVAEPRRAKEIAEAETRRAIDLLMFANGAIHSRELKTKVGLLGEVATDVCPVLYGETVDRVSSFAFDRRGSVAPLSVDENALSTMEEIGVHALSDLLTKESNELTKFEELLLRAVHWFAVSQTQEDSDNELLNLMTALEIFFNPSGSQISASIALGTAFTLSADFEVRNKIRERLKRLYRARSSISHAGKNAAAESDLNFFRSVVFGVIQAMIQRREEFGSLADIRRWVESLKWS